jgi:hypothetical protein
MVHHVFGKLAWTGPVEVKTFTDRYDGQLERRDSCSSANKLKRKGKSFDMTLIVTFNYLTRVLEGTQLNVVGAWELLKRHTIPWSWYNSRMNPEYNERTKFYFDLDAALSEHVDTPSDGPVDDMPGWASAPFIPAVRSQNSIKWETVRTTHTCPRNTVIEGVEYGEVHKKGFPQITVLWDVLLPDVWGMKKSFCCQIITNE